MKRETLADILGELQSARRDGDNFALGDGAEATLFIGAGAAVMSVGKVQRLELRRDFVLLESTKSERFYFGYAEVVGVKLESTGEKPGSRGTGFR
jgi:hypothetical protein